MNVCSKNRKGLALLAIGFLDEPEASRLRTHTETCAGCRAYLSEIQEVSAMAQAAAPTEAMEAPLGLRRRVRVSLRAERPRPPVFWRLAMPALAAMVFFLVIWPKWGKPKPATANPPASPMATTVPLPRQADASVNSAATVLAYELAANHSFDTLDKLLKQQAERGLAAAPVYRAGSLAEP